MSVNRDEIIRKLESITRIIDDSLADNDSGLNDPEIIESWLSTQLGKIRIQKLKNINDIPEEELRDNYSKDFHPASYQGIVLDNLPDMDVFLFDTKFKYIFSGGKEKEKFNKKDSDYVGKTMYEVYDKANQRKLFPFYNKVLNGRRTEGEVRLGKNVYYLVAVPVRNHQGDVSGGIIISQNVTSDKLLEESLIKSKVKAQKADRAKSLFIANISHEIRTPLNSIIGFTEQLEKTNLSEKQAQLLNHVKNASDHLLSLVQEIVFLFKLGMEKVHIEKIDFSINDLLEDIGDIIKVQVNKKGLDFSLRKDPGIPPAIKGDPFRIKQILMNLLVNAVKYTDRGGIELICEIKKETPKGVEIRFQVIDTGIGINKKDLPYIFEVFEQGHNKIDRIRGGAGLGLGICKKLVDLLKGEIGVESAINKGSKFTVILPFRKSEAEVITEKKKIFNIEDKHLKDKKILIAEDDKLISNLTEMIMKNWRVDYTIVPDGNKAMDMLDHNNYDIILLDIHMPGKDGVKVVRGIKSDSKNINYSTPVLALTANALQSDLRRYMKAGFDGYILKPFKETELYNKLCDIIMENNVEPSSQIGEINLNEISQLNDPEFETSELLKISGGDSNFFNEMIDEFITGARSMIESFNDSLAYEDRGRIGKAAHKAIPSFRYFKINDTASLLEKIENLSAEKGNIDKLQSMVKQAAAETGHVIVTAEKSKKDINKPG